MSKSSSKQQNQAVGAFVLNNEAEYPWTVFVHVPKASGGGKAKTKFKAVFRHVSQERRMQLLEELRTRLVEQRQLQTNPQDEDATDAVRDVISFQRSVLDEALVSFSGIVDAAGDEVPCTEDTKAALLENAWAQDALMAAYTTSLQGRSDEGN